MKNFCLIFALSLLAAPSFAQRKKTPVKKHRKTTTAAKVPERAASDVPPVEMGLTVGPAPSTVVEAPPLAKDGIYNSVEKLPEYPGGMDALRAYLSSNLNYPSEAVENGIRGRVVVQFVVCEDGSLCKEQVIRSIGGGCDQEAIRVIKKMPRWKPGMQNGKAVKVRYTLPVAFVLEEDTPVVEEVK